MTQEHTPRANGISSHPMHEPRVAITRGDATRDVARRWASSSHASLSLHVCVRALSFCSLHVLLTRSHFLFLTLFLLRRNFGCWRAERRPCPR